MDRFEILVLVVLTAVVSAGVGAYTATAVDDEPVEREEATVEVESHGVENASEIYRHGYREIMDSVVSIRVTSVGGVSRGTGFVYDSRGHLVTNHHVVDDAETIQVKFREGEWREAEVLGEDVYSDLAVLEVDDVPSYATPLEVAERNPSAGDLVMALGNPFGLQETITHGIVSGVNRSMDTAGGFRIPDAVQTDAAINPGNSGGPLVDASGEVVGVNRAKQGDNVGFAISPRIVQRVVPSLIEDGEYRHPYLGIGMADVTPTVAEAMDLPRVEGVLVTATFERGPSEDVLRGGSLRLRTPAGTTRIGGDVVVAVDGVEVESPEQLTSYLATRTRPGETVELTVLRDGETRTVEVELGTRPRPLSRQTLFR